MDLSTDPRLPHLTILAVPFTLYFMLKLLEIPQERAAAFIKAQLSASPWPLSKGLYLLTREAMNDPRALLSLAVASSLPIPPKGALTPDESTEAALAAILPGMYGAARHYKKSFKIDAHVEAMALEKAERAEHPMLAWEDEVSAIRSAYPLWSALFAHRLSGVRATATSRVPPLSSLGAMLPVMCSDPDPITRQMARRALGLKPKQNWKAYSASRLIVREAKRLAATVVPAEGQSLDDALYDAVNDFRPTVRAIAAFRLAPDSVWWNVLSADANASVRRSVAERIALTSPLADKLLGDEKPAVRAAISARRLAAYAAEEPYRAERRERPKGEQGPTLKQLRRSAAKGTDGSTQGVDVSPETGEDTASGSNSADSGVTSVAVSDED